MERAFTMIELIIVIAIISILASVVLVNVIQYINRTKDISVKATMDTLSQEAVIFFLEHRGWGSFCPSGSNAYQSFTGNKNCHSDENRWAFCAQLKSDPNKAWCADQTMVKKEISMDDCRANNFLQCPVDKGKGKGN